MAGLTDFALAHQAEYLEDSESEHRRQRGQVFTPPEIAQFMSGLFASIPPTFRLLDPGAGAGSLSVAFCERLLQCSAPRKLHIHAFEPEPRLADTLQRVFENCQHSLSNVGHEFSFVIQRDDFIAAASPYLEEQPLMFTPTVPCDFDGVITNPPYFKLRKDSHHAKLMRRVVHGQPNAYAFFLTLAATLLKPDGQLVAITPRSFCNGLYFRGFRRWFLDRMSLDHIHLFESRTDAFRDSGVLQESVVTKSHRLGSPSRYVSISGSFGRDISCSLDTQEVLHEDVVDDSCGERVVKIPVTQEDCEIMRLVESLPARFEQTGLRISTGPVVTFRAADLVMQEENGAKVVPLLMPHNVKPHRTVWPVTRKQHPIYIVDSEASRKRKLLVPTKNYVLLKRFSAKEEKRRLTAGCLLRSEMPTESIGLENHLNYVFHEHRDLSPDEVFGIAAVFNSSLMDRYFRIFSGNTQVNATEIRNMHFPSLELSAQIGAEVRSLPERDPSEIERLVVRFLDVKTSLVEQLAVEA